MKEVQINIFKINVDALLGDNNLKKIYYYRIILNEEEGEKTFHRLKHYGNVGGEDGKTISTIFPLNKPELEFIGDESLDKSKITQNHIKGYLRYLRYSYKLSEKLQEIDEIENYVIIPYVKFDILKEKDDFYLNLNFKYRIRLKKSMLETGFEKGDQFIFMCNDYKVHKVIKKISQNNKDKIKEIENYLKEKYKISDEINYEQQIIYAENNYHYLPQFCYKICPNRR